MVQSHPNFLSNLTWECKDLEGNELVNLNLVKIMAGLEKRGPTAKLKGTHRPLQGPEIFTVLTILKIHLNPWAQRHCVSAICLHDYLLTCVKLPIISDINHLFDLCMMSSFTYIYHCVT